MGDGPKAPELPASLPKDLRDFVECRSASVQLKDGQLDWVELPEDVKTFLPKGTKPKLTITPGATPGSATIGISIGPISLSLPATIKDGALGIDTSDVPFLVPKSVVDDIKRFVDELNGWFKTNGKGLAPPAFGKGQVGLTKVPLAPATQAATTTPPVVVPLPTGQPSGSGKGAGSAVYGSDAKAPPAPPPEEPYYETKYVEPPPLPKGELFPPRAVAPPEVKTGFAPVVGAGGPGGPKAPAGLGSMGVRAIIAVIVAAILLGGGFVALGGFGQPAVDVVPTGTAQAPGSVAPTAGAQASYPVATPFSTLILPGAVLNGRFEILNDTKVDSCNHVYEIVFSVVDSNGQTEPYVGKLATFQVLDGDPPLTATVGAGGKWQLVYPEQFVKTNSGCHSRLAPKVLTVDGKPTY